MKPKSARPCRFAGKAGELFQQLWHTEHEPTQESFGILPAQDGRGKKKATIFRIFLSKWEVFTADIYLARRTSLNVGNGVSQ
jgi:hypothetical protein